MCGGRRENCNPYSASNSAREEPIHFILLFIDLFCIFVIMVDVCIVYVHVCVHVYVPVYVYTWVCLCACLSVCACLCACTQAQGWVRVSFPYSSLCCLVTVSLTDLGARLEAASTNDPSASAFCRAGVAETSLSQHFTWVLAIKTQVVMFEQHVLLCTEPSPCTPNPVCLNW